jgi:hypothetical protein
MTQQTANLSNRALEPIVVQESREKAQRSQPQMLTDFARDADLFHSPEGEAYAVISVNDHYESWPIRHRQFRLWLIDRFYQKEEKPPPAQAVTDALTALEAKALRRGPKRAVFTRLAMAEGAIYVDLANDAWQVVEITPEGWRILDRSPVHFRRMNGMQALPRPMLGGSIEELRAFVNLPDGRSWYLLIGWLIGALQPKGPYPLLVLQGEQGSAKSTLARILRLLIDPSISPLRTIPPGERDLMIAAINAWVLSFDNLSGTPRWFSDALCRLSTGGGFALRELYTNADEIIFNAQRPIILNGIDDLAVRHDLSDRSIILNLPPIPETGRRSEAELWTAFKSARPQILGALYGATSVALANQDKVQLHVTPRMADFAKWVVAAAPALEWPESAFLEPYARNRLEAVEMGLDASPIAGLLRTIVDHQREWTGTATDLLEQLCRHASESEQRSRAWPSTAQKLSGQLKRLSPALRMAGVEVEFYRGPKRRVITLRKSHESASFSSRGVIDAPAGDRHDEDDDESVVHSCGR